MDSTQASGWIDVSVPLRTGMVHWPGDIPVKIERTRDMASGDRITQSKLSMGVHTGTHMDAPVHFIRGEAGMDAMPLDTTNGKARIIPIRDPVSIQAEELGHHDIQTGERILFKTLNSPRCWERDHFFEDYVFLSREGARFLAERRIRAVGVDYLSVASMEDGVATHVTLLSAGIWIIEGLNLTNVPPGPCELACLPLKLSGADGAPARAMVKPLVDTRHG